ncbi:MAG: hypothetical protein KC636_09790 [Myxococcales bacterium]|nr:hypothetical protein [Myxococcales bacterium]
MSRWQRAGLPDEVFESLARGLPGSSLQSLLLEVLRARARARSPVDVLAQYRRDRFTCPSPVDLRAAIEVDRLLLAATSDFDAIELSPVAPLGVTSTMAPTDQHRVLSALRGTEVASDPTNVLALECACRMRQAPRDDIHLATFQRLVRAQEVPKLPGFSQHFRLFALASGGVERRDHAATVEHLLRHVRALLRAIKLLEGAGYRFGARRVEVLAVAAKAALADRVAGELRDEVAVDRGPLDHPYYSGGLRYRLWVEARDGAATPLGDGGAFDWLATLLSNRRAVFVASGLGSQLIPLQFRARADAGERALATEGA